MSALPGVEFVNADIIAADLNPQDVDAIAIQASRLMLERLKVLSAYYQSIMNNSIPDKLSAICDPLFQKAVDEAIEQHRIKGKSIAQGENGKVKIVNSEDITSLSEKLKQREASGQTRA